MAKAQFDSVTGWLEYCHKLIAQDLDCVILFAGDPGNGKSTIALQLAYALDASFNEDRIHFKVKPFLATARSCLPGQVVLADELPLHRRKAMTRETKDLLDFMQVCRGLNLFLLICFPTPSMLDRDLLDQRVRYKVEIENPQNPEQDYRTAHIYEREKVEIKNQRGEEDYIVHWKHVLSFRFVRNRGPLWEAYLAKKVLAAREREADAQGKTLEEVVDAELNGARPYLPKMKRQEGSGRQIQLRVRPSSPLHSVFHPAAEDKTEAPDK